MDDQDLYDMLSASPARDEAVRAFVGSLVKKAMPYPMRKKVTPSDMREVQARMAAVAAKMKKTVVATRLPPKKLVKRASIKDHLQGVTTVAKDWALRNKPELIGGAIGATAGGLYGYAASKRHDPNKPSAMERDAQGMISKHEIAAADLARSGKKPGLGHKLHGAYGRAFADMAKQLREHPVASGVLFGGAGGSLGASLGRTVHEIATDT